MKTTVLLEDGTVGTLTQDKGYADDLIGEIVRVKLHDENGNPIEVDGKLVEALEDSKY